MIYNSRAIHTLYRKLLALYPREFRDRFAEAMEQTFQDLYNEKRQTKKELLSFILWTFTETALSIFREYVLLLSSGDMMQTLLKTIGSSSLVSFLITLPFVLMEVVNRRNYNEEFPFTLFFGLWLNLFAISLILFPITQARRIGKYNTANPAPAQGKALITNPKSTLIISIFLILLPITFALMTSPGQSSISNPEGFSVFNITVPSQLIVIILISIPVATGIIASRPIVNTLRAGGSLLTHPIHMIIVIVVLFLLTVGSVGLIVDQWPCFIGVQFCD